MNKGSDFGPEFEAKSSVELLNKYKIKLENAKKLKESKGCTSKQEKSSNLIQAKNQQDVGTNGGSIQKLDRKKQPWTTGAAMQVTKSTQILHKKQEQRNQPLNNGAATQPIKSTSIPIQKDLRMTHQDQVSEEEQVSKKTIEQNFVKRQVRSIVGNQDQGLA